jgi:pyruvate kinase
LTAEIEENRMKKFTKIVATVSDRRCDREFIASLFNEGMNVVRMNSAHLSPEGLKEIVHNARLVSPSIALMLDTKGPEIRTTVNAEDKSITFLPGQKVIFTGNTTEPTNQQCINLNYADIAKDVKPGFHLLIDDGALDFLVDSVEGETINATSQNEGVLGSRKTVNIPGAHIQLPAVTERDKQYIKLAVELGVDFIAHSFVRSADDIRAVKKVIADCGGNIEIVAKIENQQGIDNFNDILDEAYGIMIARGDLGIEVAAERIPSLQAQMIKGCINRHKPVIVATQMLHSMINSPRPTRAEVTDVASAVAERADAVMLSGETANGKYPVEAVRTMAAIAREAERWIDEEPIPVPELTDDEVTSFLARQAVVSRRRLHTKAIICDTYTGRTARYIASFRGRIPTIAICYRPEAMRLLSLSYGVEAITVTCNPSTRECLRSSLDNIVAEGHLDSDDRVAYLGGRPGEGNLTTCLQIDTLAHITRL